MNSYKPCPFFETSAPARAGHYWYSWMQLWTQNLAPHLLQSANAHLKWNCWETSWNPIHSSATAPLSRLPSANSCPNQPKPVCKGGTAWKRPKRGKGPSKPSRDNSSPHCAPPCCFQHEVPTGAQGPTVESALNFPALQDSGKDAFRATWSSTQLLVPKLAIWRQRNASLPHFHSRQVTVWASFMHLLCWSVLWRHPAPSLVPDWECMPFQMTYPFKESNIYQLWQERDFAAAGTRPHGTPTSFLCKWGSTSLFLLYKVWRATGLLKHWRWSWLDIIDIIDIIESSISSTSLCLYSFQTQVRPIPGINLPALLQCLWKHPAPALVHANVCLPKWPIQGKHHLGLRQNSGMDRPAVIQTYGLVWITCVLVWIGGMDRPVDSGCGSGLYILTHSQIYQLWQERDSAAAAL